MLGVCTEIRGCWWARSARIRRGSLRRAKSRPASAHRGVPGVSKTALWESWKDVRKKLRDSSLRDVVDWVEYDVDPEKWILRLRDQVLEGRYEPQRPLRFPLGKSKGLSRWMTQPTVPDLVLFHAIATRVVERAQRRRRRHRHVYFMRDRISKVQKEAFDDATKKIRQDPHYRTGFYVWLRFHQYRRWLIFKRLYPFIVVTDITNFFDSVVYTQLEATLFELGIQRNVVGLLFLVLERLSIVTRTRRFLASVCPSTSSTARGASRTRYFSRTTIGWLDSSARVPTFAGWTTRPSG